MKPSIEKIVKFFNLEAERGFDNRAVLGGLDQIREHWEAEARSDNIPESIISLVSSRIKDYSHISQKSREESLNGLLKRIQKELQDPAVKLKVPAKQKSESIQNAQSSDPNVDKIEQSPPQKQASHKTEIQEQKPAAIVTIEKADLSALEAPITSISGVGPRHAQNLERLGIITLHDALYYFPRRYDDYSKLKPINRLEYRDELTVIGTVQSIKVRQLYSGKKQLIEVILNDGTGNLRVNWFNQIWLTRQIHKGMQIVIAGKIDQYLGRLVMTNPDWEPLEEEYLSTSRIVPIYPLTAKITQKFLRRLINRVVNYWAPRMPDFLPKDLQKNAGLVDLTTALQQIHYPDSWDELKKARERLAFDEIFLLQLGVLRQKQIWQERFAHKFTVTDGWLNRQISQLSFQLTNAQQKVINEIRYDLASGHPMNRLIQGDVGSGKTIVAAMAIAIISQTGAQSAFMAPTSILAEQHYRTLVKILATNNQGTNVAAPEQIRLLIGATPETEKQEIREGLENGSIKLVIGTHALIEDPVKFKNLQLIIVDEQHRFGVKQRALLRAKGENPHLIVMTATPIPRSLALTVYGDLDISIIDEMPPGRKPVATFVLMPIERERAYTLIENQVKNGHQTFIIYPLIEENEKSKSKSAVAEHKRLQTEVFPNLRIGLLHGRMKPDEKEKVMADFRDGKYKILVSTSVIEVGVDIPNATVMLIEGANRFGLAQLHQFRGRVGRGGEKSYCLLIPETANDVENDRLKVMTQTNDGFILAEKDLEQRGPGEFLGTRQSGYSGLKMANLTDVKLIEKARKFAKYVFTEDPDLTQPEHQAIALAFSKAWGDGKGDIS